MFIIKDKGKKKRKNTKEAKSLILDKDHTGNKQKSRIYCHIAFSLILTIQFLTMSCSSKPIKSFVMDAQCITSTLIDCRTLSFNHETFSKINVMVKTVNYVNILFLYNSVHSLSFSVLSFLGRNKKVWLRETYIIRGEKNYST